MYKSWTSTRKHEGAQCLILNNEKEEVAIPLSYKRGITILPCEEPTDEEIRTLPILDIIDPTGILHPHTVEIETFDLQLCNKTLTIWETRRAKSNHRKNGSRLMH